MSRKVEHVILSKVSFRVDSGRKRDGRAARAFYSDCFNRHNCRARAYNLLMSNDALAKPHFIWRENVIHSANDILTTHDFSLRFRVLRFYCVIWIIFSDHLSRNSFFEPMTKGGRGGSSSGHNEVSFTSK